MRRDVIDIIGGQYKEIIHKHESKTWGGDDFDMEDDHFLTVWKENDDAYFIQEYVNKMEHSMDAYYDIALIRCGYYRKDGTPLSIALYYDGNSKRDPKSIALYSPIKIMKEEKDMIGTIERDGLIYSGKFVNGKLHGFGVVASGDGDTIKIVEIGLYDNGKLIDDEISMFYQSNLNNLPASSKFLYAFKDAKSAKNNECNLDIKMD